MGRCDRNTPGAVRKTTVSLGLTISRGSVDDDAAMISLRSLRVSSQTCLAAALLPTVLLFSSCDDSKPKTAKKTAEKKVRDSSEVESIFKDARAQILDGKYKEAADKLKELSADPTTIKRPQLDWIIFYEGLALGLDGKDKEARDAFGRVEDLGVDAKATDAPQASYVVKLSHQLRGDQPIKPDDIQEVDRSNYEGISYLLYAAKDWGMEQYELAIPSLENFDHIMPERMVFWADGPEELAKLKQLAAGCVNDYKEYKPIAEMFKNAVSPEQQAAAVAAGKEARGRMKLHTKITQSLDATLADVGPKVAAIMDEKAKASAEEQGYDAKMLPEAKQKRADLMTKFQFAQSKEAINDPRFKTDAAKDEQRILAKRSSWLANFKSQLIEDFNAKGYKQPVPRKTGTPLGVGIVKADEDSVFMNYQGAPTPVPWGDLSPEALYAIAKSYITTDMTPQILSFRKWHLGVYASYLGKKDEALALMKEAAETRTILKSEIPAFEAPITTW